MPSGSQDSGPAVMELTVDLGPMPVDALSGAAIEGGGLRGLLEKGEFCDVTLVAGGQSFSAHSLVLAAVSPSFHTQIQQEHAKGTRGNVTIELNNVSHSEAVQDMLACIYGPFGVDAKESFCKTELANRDALQLAQSYQIPQLQDQVSRWLAQSLTSQNVLGRLLLCEEFNILEVREKILEQLIADPAALPLLARHPEVTKAPKVLQDLLVRILSLLGLEFSANPQHVAPPTKRSASAVEEVAHPPAKRSSSVVEEAAVPDPVKKHKRSAVA